MPPLVRWLALTSVVLFAAACSDTPAPAGPPVVGHYDVRRYGAHGDGVTLDTAAVNAAIAAAADAGGGTVFFPAGTYACHSVRLRSHITLRLDAGATLAAAPPTAAEGYDPPEPNPFDLYQDFGHSHFHNSLIWGDGLTDVAIVGPGTIDGSHGLARGSTFDVDPSQIGSGMVGVTSRRSKDRFPGEAAIPYPDPREQLSPGSGDKAIALKLCRGVTLRDLTIRGGGHFALLATGDERVTIDNLTVDTNRDGFDIDSCRDVRISNCSVNSPHDDAICLKSDLALGTPRPCQDVTITNCQVSGFDCPTLLDGRRLHGGGNGRIKLGTESNGGFKNITISNCVFESCKGLALETVDGGPLEDVAIDNLTMRHPSNSPIFLRLGARLRGPTTSTAVAPLARVSISNVVASDVDPQYASIIAGIPGHDVTGVTLSNLQLFARGGGAKATRAWAATRPAERIDAYPDPRMFGPTPAYGFYVRHAADVAFNNVAVHVAREDLRPAFVLDDVTDVRFADVTAEQSHGVPPLAVHAATGVTVHDFPGALVPPTTRP